MQKTSTRRPVGVFVTGTDTGIGKTLVSAILARAWKKLNYAELCGLLAGSMTDPPALAYAQQTTNSDAPAVACSIFLDSPSAMVGPRARVVAVCAARACN